MQYKAAPVAPREQEGDPSVLRVAAFQAVTALQTPTVTTLELPEVARSSQTGGVSYIRGGRIVKPECAKGPSKSARATSQSVKLRLTEDALASYHTSATTPKPPDFVGVPRTGWVLRTRAWVTGDVEGSSESGRATPRTFYPQPVQSLMPSLPTTATTL